MDEEDERDRLDLRELAREILGGRSLAPRVAELLDLAAERARHRRPALAERPGRDGEHALARRAEVDDRRLEATGARAGEEEHFRRGPVDLLQPAEHPRVHLAEVRRAMVDHLLGERGEHLRRHRGRPGREQVPLLRHRRRLAGAETLEPCVSETQAHSRPHRCAGRGRLCFRNTKSLPTTLLGVEALLAFAAALLTPAARRSARRALAASGVSRSSAPGAPASPPTRSGRRRSPGARPPAGTRVCSAPTTSSAGC